MSLKGRVLNIFVLSKLWYILESQEISPHVLNELNNDMIKNFVWKDIHQTQFNSLHDKYEECGLSLQGVSLKQQAH